MQKLCINQTNYVIFMLQHRHKMDFWSRSEVISRLFVAHPKLVRLEGGACVMTEVGEGMVGWRASKPKCSGREPGRTMVGVGAELLGGVSWGNKNDSS